MGKWIDTILEYLGIKNRYKQLMEAEEIIDISGVRLDTNDNSFIDRKIQYEGKTIKGMQIGDNNIKSNKTAEAKAFEQQLRNNIDLKKVQQGQSEIGRKYSQINEEHFNNRGKDSNISINNSRVVGGIIDLDAVDVNNSKLENVKTYRSGEQELG